MKPISLKEIAESCNGTLFGDEHLTITSIVTDSRKAGEGSLFAAIKGARVDGHDYIAKVREQGAVCVICEKKPDADIPYILTDSTAVALKGIARYYRSLFSIPFVGITGSVGKTTTKEFIYSVLKEKYNTHKTQGNFNNELGVPLTLFGLEEEHEAAVIEMGISGFSEMTRLSEMVCPDIAVITNIGCCHLENLKNRDGVLKAKAEMFTHLREGGHIVLCGDDDKLSAIREYNGIKPIFYGIETDREYYAKDIEDNLLLGLNCTLCHHDTRIRVHIPAPGRHMVENALAAFAVGELLGLSPDEIKRGIESFHNVGSRSNIIDNGSYVIIDDCYNANPTSVKASLDILSNVKGRTAAILGDMKELGENEIALHYEVGQYAREKGIDLLVAAGPLSKSLAEGYGDGAVYFETPDLACEKIKDLVHAGDTALVKASHSMHFERIVEALK